MFIGLLIFVSSYFYHQLFFRSYSATVDFTLNTSALLTMSVYEPVFSENVSSEPNDISIIYSIIYSIELLDTISQKFNLYAHYGIDTSKAYHYENLVHTLIGSLNLNVVNEKLFSLTFHDRNNQLAADIANEIVRQINLYFKRNYKAGLINKIKFYETIMIDVSEKDSIKRLEIYKILQDIKPFTGSLSDKNNEAYSLRKKIDYLIDQLYYNKENILSTYKLYQSSIRAIDILDIKILTILRKALPETEKNIFYKILLCVAISFFGLCLYIVFLYFYLVNKHLIRLFFSKN